MTKLANPVWRSLQSEHAHFARGGPDVQRYRHDVAPFVAVLRADASVDDELEALVEPGETFYVVDVAPRLPRGWPCERSRVLQMRCDVPMEETALDCRTLTLGEDDIDDMLALTAIAYPAFFRPRTLELGAYLGVRADGRLVAMAGERMRATGYQEISAICTHPDHRGRGYARHLTAPLVKAQLARGVVPFLHVSASNTHAVELYERWGFVHTGDVTLWKVQRPGASS